MAQFALYVDLGLGALVTSPTNSATVRPPNFVQGDTLGLQVWLLQPTGNMLAPYTQVPTAGLTIELALGSKVGSGSTVYANQYVWTASTDPGNPNYWFANLALNTTPINTLLGSSASAPAWLEIKYVAGGVPSTVLQQQVTIQAAVIQGGALIIPPGLNPVSAEYANATYLQRTINGPFFLVDPNTGKKLAIYVGDDNKLHADPVG